jgi:hypothetical protein
MPIIE